MKLNGKEFAAVLEKQAAACAKVLQQGMSAKEAAKEIYKTMGNRTDAAADIFVDELLEQIDRFHHNLDACSVDSAGFIRAQLMEKSAQFESAEDRCAFYHRVVTAVDAQYVQAVYGDEKPNAGADYYTEHKELKTFVNPEKEEAEYLEAAVDKLDGAEANANMIGAVMDMLGGGEDPDDPLAGLRNSVGGIVTELDDDSEWRRDLELILVTQTYVNAVRGQYKDVSPQVPLSALAAAVCGWVEISDASAKAERQLEQPGMTEEQKASVLDILEKVLKAVVKVASIALLTYILYSCMLSLTSLFMMIHGVKLLNVMMASTAVMMLYMTVHGQSYVRFYTGAVEKITSAGGRFLLWLGKKTFSAAGYVIGWVKQVTSEAYEKVKDFVGGISFSAEESETVQNEKNEMSGKAGKVSEGVKQRKPEPAM